MHFSIAENMSLSAKIAIRDFFFRIVSANVIITYQKLQINTQLKNFILIFFLAICKILWIFFSKRWNIMKFQFFFIIFEFIRIIFAELFIDFTESGNTTIIVHCTLCNIAEVLLLVFFFF